MDLQPDHLDASGPSAARRPAPRGRWQHAAAWLQATPAELLGLIVLLTGALVVTALVFWDAERRPSQLPSAAATVGQDVDVDHPDADAGSGQAAKDGGADATGDDTEITVHISGAVASTGVVTLGSGSRVADAIAVAGGATADAELDRLNLARILVDGEQVHVPRPGDGPLEVDPDASVVADGVLPDGRVDLNRATQETLETLPGIGPAKAAAILTHRDAEGPFEVPGDLRGVPGIGEATFQQLADLVAVG